MIYLPFWNQAPFGRQMAHPNRIGRLSAGPVLASPNASSDRCLDTCFYFCAVLLGMCFENMRTNLVSLFAVWSNCSDAMDSISSRCASNSAGESRPAPLQRPAKSPSAALLIWHCTICSPFLIVNLNTIKLASYPRASPRVSGMDRFLSNGPLRRTAKWPPAERLVLLPTVTDPALFGPAGAL